MMDVARDESGGWRGRAQRVLRAETLFGGSPVTVHTCLDSLKALRESPQNILGSYFLSVNHQDLPMHPGKRVNVTITCRKTSEII